MEQFHTPPESRELLLDAIRSATKKEGGMSFEEVREFEGLPGVYFGPGVDIVDVLVANEDMGRLVIDLDNERVVALKTSDNNAS